MLLFFITHMRKLRNGCFANGTYITVLQISNVIQSDVTLQWQVHNRISSSNQSTESTDGQQALLKVTTINHQ